MIPIVVGFVDTPEGRAAVEAAVEQAGLREGRLHIVVSMRGGAHTSFEEVAATRKRLEALSQDLTERGVEHRVHEVARGTTPADDLAYLARETGAGLIVIGYRRRSPAGKALLGSDAQQILLNAPCPVLMVRPPVEVE